MEPLEIVEVKRRFEHGQTGPLLVEASDGESYVVKSRRAGRDSLINEWMAGHAARELGLRIPPFRLVKAREDQVRFFTFEYREDAAALARMPGFASRYVQSTSLFSSSSSPHVNPAERAAILAFDHWVRNGDRTDGNPNLIWSAAEKQLHVIDHNLAFGPPDESLIESHIFHEDRRIWTSDYCAPLASRMMSIIPSLKVAWDNMPMMWTEDGDQNLEYYEEVLRRVEEPSFWNNP